MIEKINDLQGVSQVNGAKSRKWASYGVGEAAAAQDGLAVSPFAREMATISAELSKVPEVREDKVADIKNRIDNGTYKIDFDGLASNLVWAGINKTED